MAIGRGGLATILDSHQPGLQLYAVEGSKTVYRRNPSTLTVVDGVGPPMTLGTVPALTQGQRFVKVDGSDVLITNETGSGNAERTIVTRYPAASMVMEAPGRAQRIPQVDAAGRVWILTSRGLFRSEPRAAPAVAIPVTPVAGMLPTAFHVLPSGSALVATQNVVTFVSPAGTSTPYATLPATSSISAIAAWQGGFAAIAGSDAFVSTPAGPVRRVLTQNPLSSFRSHEPFLATSAGNLFVSTLCMSWSGYPAYDTAVVDPSAGTVSWWWNSYATQHDVPVFPTSSANVSGDVWESVPTMRSTAGFIRVF